jgi:hypothetical protein
VPPFGRVSTIRVPPSSSARSRIELIPTPALRPSATPTPSSTTSSSRLPFASSTERLTWQVPAPEWRVALDMASWAMR